MLGVHPAERLSERIVSLDVEWSGYCESGSAPAVDYDEVCALLARLDGSSFRFIEELASEALSTLRDRFPEGRWSVTVHKECPPAALRLERASFTAWEG